MPVVLEIVSGPLKGKKVVAQAHQIIRVGRTAKADIPTQDSFMSGEHFAVEGDGQVWRIRDLKSRNGTKLNGSIIASAEIREGDQIHAGSTDFVVRILPETAKSPPVKPEQLMATLPPSGVFPGAPGKSGPEMPSSTASTAEQAQHRIAKQIAAKPAKPGPPAKPRRAGYPSPQTKEPGSKSAYQSSRPKSRRDEPVTSPVPAPTPMESYEAATPEGRLLRLLGHQAEPLMALLDATHKRDLPELLADSGEEFQPLYQDPRNAALTPYLVRLPPQSSLLRQMVHDGWGHGWGVYLTCKQSLPQLRDYYRQALMVRLPDGIELFSRFYDPRFFRTFLEGCTAPEADKFFGPVSSYLMEADKSEILLQFTRTKRGVEKQGHLLSTLE